MYWIIGSIAVTAATLAYNKWFSNSDDKAKEQEKTKPAPRTQSNNDCVRPSTTSKPPVQPDYKEIINSAVFILGGYLISLKGKIKTADIELLDAYIDSSKKALSKSERDQVYAYFQMYKRKDFKSTAVINSLRKTLDQSQKDTFCCKLIEFVILVSDGSIPHINVISSLKEICSSLGYSISAVDSYVNQVITHSGSKLKEGLGRIDIDGGIAKAYEILGIDEKTSFSKAAANYRRLRKINHPDMHVNNSEQMRKQAEETFKNLNLAWDCVVEAHGWNN